MDRESLQVQISTWFTAAQGSHENTGELGLACYLVISAQQQGLGQSIQCLAKHFITMMMFLGKSMQIQAGPFPPFFI